jgi:hypothetical protein
LQAGSPCIDAGNNADVPAGILTDLVGYPRFLDDPATADCRWAPGTCGAAPVVDMGAYEFAPDSDGDGVSDIADNCPDAANATQLDSDRDSLGDACDACPQDPLNDSDGDGVCGDVDGCADSDVSETIVIDGCDTGVANQVLDDGCTMADEIAKAAAAGNHGQFVSAVAHLTKAWMKAGRITGADKGRIQRCVGRADFDDDGDVDVIDFKHFQTCFNGPNRFHRRSECGPADFDDDNDVDLADFVTFESCFNGPNRAPRCAE